MQGVEDVVGHDVEGDEPLAGEAVALVVQQPRRCELDADALEVMDLDLLEALAAALLVDAREELPRRDGRRASGPEVVEAGQGELLVEVQGLDELHFLVGRQLLGRLGNVDRRYAALLLAFGLEPAVGVGGCVGVFTGGVGCCVYFSAALLQLARARRMSPDTFETCRSGGGVTPRHNCRVGYAVLRV